MLPFVPLASVFVALLSETDRAKFTLRPPTELEDLVIAGVVSDKAATAALLLAELGWTGFYSEEFIDGLRALLDEAGLESAMIVSGDPDFTSFYGVIVEGFLVRAEPWCFACVDTGYLVGSESNNYLEALARRKHGEDFPPLPEKPSSFEERLDLYKQEALHRRGSLRRGHPDGPPKTYRNLVFDLWVRPGENDRGDAEFEAVSIEIWSQTMPAPKQPAITRARKRS